MANFPTSNPSKPSIDLNSMQRPTSHPVDRGLLWDEVIAIGSYLRATVFSFISSHTQWRDNLTEELGPYAAGSTVYINQSSLCGGLGVKFASVTGGSGRVVQHLDFAYELTSPPRYKFVMPAGSGDYSLHVIGGQF